MSEIKTENIFLILGFLVGLVLVVVLTYLLNKRVFKRNFIYQETILGKVKDIEIGDDGHSYVVVEYNINGKNYETRIAKTKLVPSRKGFPIFIDVNSVNPSEALPHSIVPLIASMIIFIVAIVSFIIVSASK